MPENWCWIKLGAVITASKEKQDVFDSETKYVGLEHIEKDTGNGSGYLHGFLTCQKLTSQIQPDN